MCRCLDKDLSKQDITVHQSQKAIESKSIRYQLKNHNLAEPLIMSLLKLINIQNPK